MFLNIDADIKYQLSLVKREAGETDDQLGARLYWIQHDVVEANCAGNVSAPSFDQLTQEQKNAWIEKAKTYK